MKHVKELYGATEYEVRQQAERFDGWRLGKVRRFNGGWAAIIYHWS